VQRSPASEIARSPDAWERIAKDWLVEVIERTPLDDVEGLPLAWMAREAAPLIAEILGQLSDPGLTRELALPPSARDRAASLASETLDASRLPRELAALQSLLIEALGREIREHDRGEFARAVSRLAEVFGAVQSAALEGIVQTRSGGAAADPRTGMPAAADLHEWLRIMIAESRPSARPFAIAHIEIDGMERIKAAYGSDAAESMAAAVAGIVEAQTAERDRAFRPGEAQIVVLREDRDAAQLAEFASRLCETVEDSQSSAGARVSVAIGLASFPAHGDRPETLLGSAEEAAWAAAANGDAFVLATGSLQDP
jgi:diguanylate cyclase (GGDEF)-like protein